MMQQIYGQNSFFAPFLMRNSMRRKSPYYVKILLACSHLGKFVGKSSKKLKVQLYFTLECLLFLAILKNGGLPRVPGTHTYYTARYIAKIRKCAIKNQPVI